MEKTKELRFKSAMQELEGMDSKLSNIFLKIVHESGDDFDVHEGIRKAVTKIDDKDLVKFIPFITGFLTMSAIQDDEKATMAVINDRPKIAADLTALTWIVKTCFGVTPERPVKNDDIDYVVKALKENTELMVSLQLSMMEELTVRYLRLLKKH